MARARARARARKREGARARAARTASASPDIHGASPAASTPCASPRRKRAPPSARPSPWACSAARRRCAACSRRRRKRGALQPRRATHCARRRSRRGRRSHAPWRRRARRRSPRATWRRDPQRLGHSPTVTSTRIPRRASETLWSCNWTKGPPNSHASSTRHSPTTHRAVRPSSSPRRTWRSRRRRRPWRWASRLWVEARCRAAVA